MVGFCVALFVFILPQAAALYVGGYVALGCLRWWAALPSGITAAMLVAGLVGASGGILMDLCGVPGEMYIGPPWAPLLGYVSMIVAFWPGVVAGIVCAVIVGRRPVAAQASALPEIPSGGTAASPPDDRVRASSAGEYAERRQAQGLDDLREDRHRDAGRYIAPAAWLLALLAPYLVAVGAVAVFMRADILPGMLKDYWGLTDGVAEIGGPVLVLFGGLAAWMAYRMPLARRR